MAKRIFSDEHMTGWAEAKERYEELKEQKGYLQRMGFWWLDSYSETRREIESEMKEANEMMCALW